jgi:hypothetical protein
MDDRPPRLANWGLNLFVSKQQVSPLIGDLREEFAAVASQRGLASARRWYWRQAAKTVPHLFLAQLGVQPWQTFTALVAGLVLLWLVNIPMVAIRNYYPNGWPEFVRFAWLLGYPVVALVAPPILSGCVVAGTTRRRGLADTVLMSLVVLAFRVGVALFFPKQLAELPPAWSLIWVHVTSTWVGLSAPIGVGVWPMLVFVGGLSARRLNSVLVHPAQ